VPPLKTDLTFPDSTPKRPLQIKADFALGCPTACVTCVWAGVDSAWEQEKLEARKMLENAADSHTSGARCVRRFSYVNLNITAILLLIL
jgi:hypothetical protein